MENKKHLKNLFSKYLNNNCNEAEINLLLDHFALKNEEGSLKEMIQTHMESELTVHTEDEKAIEAALFEVKENLLKKLSESEPSAKFKWLTIYRVAAAAVVLLTISAGLYFYSGEYPITEDDLYSFNKANDIAPGKNTATLTLANGNQISLNDSKNGILFDSDAVRYVSTNKPAALSVHPISTKEQISIQTPPGGTYQVALSDGTKIWLNAASSLKFYSNFSGLKDRRIELQGEAYFEVAKDKRRPFKVQTKGQEVEVLGTHFNISNYSEEGNASTTLLEGSVRVTASSGQSVNLLPDQRSVISGKNIIVQPANVKEAVAWKKGQFLFDGTDFKSVMGQLARWYNVEVDTENLPDKQFNGLISRSVKLSEVLRALEMTSNVRFKIEGRRITIK